MSLEIPLDQLPGVDKEIVARYIREQSFFETVVSYIIDWSMSWKSYNLQKWLSTATVLPSELIDQTAYISKLKNNKEKMLDILGFVNSKITYIGDSKKWKVEEKWQTAEQTWSLKTGDCEDGAILIYSIAHYYGIPDWQVYLVAGDVKGGGHCYVTYFNTQNALEYPIDWCYWFSESIRVKIPYVAREEYYYGQKEWFRFNLSGMYKMRESIPLPTQTRRKNKMADKFSFKGWDVKKFIAGRKRLLVTMVGALAGYLITQSPALTAVIAAGTEMVYALIDYWAQP